LSSISFDRSVSAGRVLVDTDENVAIQITNISNYSELVKSETNGEVSLNLNAALGTNPNGGFNTDAVFSIGTSSNGVIKIKNNSDIPVTATLVNNGDRSIAMSPVNGSGNTIDAGRSGDFYFTIDTNGKNAAELLNATLHIEGGR
jgi:hypothetical protein